MLLVGVERILLVATHQINIELRYSRARERSNLFHVGLGGTEQAEPVSHFIRNEVRLLLSTSQW